MQISPENKPMRIGIMGGTFDPIHHGHLVAASEVQNVFKLDEVIFVPASVQPFKQGRDLTLAEHRYLMTTIATASNPKFSVSRVDIERGGVTYTIDTLTDLKKQYPKAEFFFITGADAIESIMNWKNSEELFKLAKFIGVTRPNHIIKTENLEKISILEIPAMAISSTDCRNRIAEKKPIRYLVPDGVVQYIGKYNLYKKKDKDK